MSTLDELLDDIFDGKQPPLYEEFAEWVRGSRRFRAFATAHQSKIRQKVRHANDDGLSQDLRAELEAAALLLREERFALEYEKYAATKQRGPDFTVTYKTHTPFNVEVRRIRGVELEADDEAARMGKLMAVLCDKAGQMPPRIVNLLWLTAERAISETDINGAAAALRQLAERKDEDYFRRRRFESAAAFLRQFRLLSGIVLRQPDEIAVWLNSLAKHSAPPDIVRAIQRLESF